MADIKQMLTDPAFHRQPTATKLAALDADDRFRTMTPQEKGMVLSEFGKEIAPISSRPMSAPPKQKGFMDHLADFGKEAYEGVTGAAKGMLDTGKTLASDSLTMGPMNALGKTGANIVKSAGQDMYNTAKGGVEEIGQAYNDMTNPNNGSDHTASFSSGIGKVAAGAIPFAGPVAARAGEEIGQGNYGTGAAKTAGAFLSNPAGVSVPKAAGKVAAGTVAGAMDGAKVPFNTSWKEAGMPSIIGGAAGVGLGHHLGGWEGGLVGGPVGAAVGQKAANVAQGAVSGARRGLQAASGDLAVPNSLLEGMGLRSGQNAGNGPLQNSGVPNTGPVPGQQYLEGEPRPPNMDIPMTDPRRMNDVINMERVPQQQVESGVQAPQLPAPPRTFEMPPISRGPGLQPEMGPNPVWEMPGKVKKVRPKLEDVPLGPNQAKYLDPEFPTQQAKPTRPNLVEDTPNEPVIGNRRVSDSVPVEPSGQRRKISKAPRETQETQATKPDLFPNESEVFDKDISDAAKRVVEGKSGRERKSGGEPEQDVMGKLQQSIDNLKAGKKNTVEVVDKSDKPVPSGLGNTKSNAKVNRIASAFEKKPNKELLQTLIDQPHDSPVWEKAFKELGEDFPTRWTKSSKGKTSPTIGGVVERLKKLLH